MDKMKISLKSIVLEAEKSICEIKRKKVVRITYNKVPSENLLKEFKERKIPYYLIHEKHDITIDQTDYHLDLTKIEINYD